MSNKPHKGANQAQNPQNGNSTRSVIAHHQYYEGQLPPPDMLERFEAIQPGFTDRLLTMVEKESEFKRESDRSSLNTFRFSTILGIICAFLAVLAVSGVAIYCIYSGFGTQAASIMGTSAAAVIIAFLQRRRRGRD